MLQNIPYFALLKFGCFVKYLAQFLTPYVYDCALNHDDGDDGRRDGDDDDDHRDGGDGHHDDGDDDVFVLPVLKLTVRSIQTRIHKFRT